MKNKLYVEEINYRLGYVAIRQKNTNKVYFSQGDNGINDIEFINEHGEKAFLDYLNSSGYFD